MAETPFVLRAQTGSVLTLTLNRGERFNPLSLAMVDALQAEFDRASEDQSVRVIVLAAAGRGFSAGHDLKEVKSHLGDDAWQQHLFARCSRMMVTMTRLPQPIIARVHGIATAAGCQLVATCDLAVAADTATFALPGVNIGLFCSTPAVGVGRNVSRKRVMEMLLTGQSIDAATALAWGLVNRVAPIGELDRVVAGFADLIAAKSATTIALGKQAFYRQIERGLEPAYQLTGEVMAGNLKEADAAEGIGAFLEKRPPVWAQSRTA